jgi:hypothetical protein
MHLGLRPVRAIHRWRVRPRWQSHRQANHRGRQNHIVDRTGVVHYPASTEAATLWWSDLTAVGGEGMVVKPRDFIAQGRKGPVQPAVKCRGPEYLRINYGPEYDAPEHLARLRSRGLGRKRSLATRDFLLGQEALRRFIAREPTPSRP